MLTARQEEMLEFIRGYQAAEGIPPSTRVVQKRFGFASQNAVMSHLRALATKGAVVQLADGSWGVKAKEVQGLFELPLYGSIPAGWPEERREESGETVLIDPARFGVVPGRRPRLWALRIEGDSMEGAHILAGDIGVFERREAQPGDIVAALVDGATTTLKRWVQVEGRAVLRAANPRYADIVPVETWESQGVLVGLIRQC